jgi:hypothetical protein
MVMQTIGDWSKQSKLEWLIPLLNELRYGSVQITVHDGKIVQVDRTEKFRADTPSKNNGRK